MAARHAVEVEDCKQEDRLTAAERELGRLNNAVFFGENALTTQVGSVQTVLRLLCWLVGGSCMAVLGQVVVMIFKAVAK